MRYHVRYGLLIGALIAFIIGYSVFWFAMARSVKADVGAWITARNAEGYRVSTAGYKITGFPSTLVLTIDQPKVARPAAAWVWSAPKLTVYAEPWNLHHIIIDFGAAQRFTFGSGALRQTVDLAARNAKASALLDKNFRVAALDSILAGATFTSSLGGRLVVGEAQAHERVSTGAGRTNSAAGPALPAGGVEMAFFGKDITLPAGAGGPLGAGVKNFTIEIAVPPPLPSGIEDLATWSKDGGTVKITRFDLDWGKLKISGSGTATVDDQMRLEAAFETEVGGFDQAIDALVKAGEMGTANGERAKIVLGLLAKPGKDGERRLKVPLTAEHGRLYAGPVALASLPSLAPLSSAASGAGSSSSGAPPTVSVSPLPAHPAPPASPASR